MSNDTNFSLPDMLKGLAYGDFVYDKTLGFLVYHEFGFLACRQLASDHIYPLETFETGSSLVLTGPVAVVPLNAMAVMQPKILGIDNRKVYSMVNNPIRTYPVVGAIGNLLRELYKLLSTSSYLPCAESNG